MISKIGHGGGRDSGDDAPAAERTPSGAALSSATVLGKGRTARSQRRSRPRSRMHVCAPVGGSNPLTQFDVPGPEPEKRTPSSGTTDVASTVSAIEVLKGSRSADVCPASTPSSHSTPQSCPFALMCFRLAETSEHHTLGGKDAWGKKQRREFRHDRHDRLSGSERESGFLSAPWKFFKFGASTKGSTDAADTSGTRLLPVKKVPPMRLLLCVRANQEMADLCSEDHDLATELISGVL